jgi:hypothetical protein
MLKISTHDMFIWTIPFPNDTSNLKFEETITIPFFPTRNYNMALFGFNIRRQLRNGETC